MKRWVSGLIALVALLALAPQARAQGERIVWEKIPLKFMSSGVARDSISLPAVLDSVRTDWLKLDNIAWDVLNSAAGPIGASVIFTTSTAGADTVYYGVELGYAGQAQRMDPLLLTAAVTSAATGPSGQTGVVGTGTYFLGQIPTATSALSAVNNSIAYKPQFRLFIRNNAATGGLNRLRGYVILPVRYSGHFKWRAEQLKWSRASGTRDTVNLAAAKDSARTLVYDLPWAWQALQTQNSGGAIAPVTVIFSASAAGGDSVYFGLENCKDGGCNRVNPLGLSASAKSSASVITDTGGVITGDGKLFFGNLGIDIDTWAVAGNAINSRGPFRLFVKAPSAATLTGLKVWVYGPMLNQ